MSPEESFTAVRRESQPLLRIPSSEFDVQVPACPDWNLGDLMSHIGWVYRFWAFVAELPEGERVNREGLMAAGLPKVGSAARPDAELLPWFQQSLDCLFDSYRRQTPAKLIDSRGWGQQPLSWIARRMAHETAIHRWDAEQALGTASGFEPALAADGIDEFLEYWVPVGFRYADFGRPACTIALDATDSADNWRISVAADATTWKRGDGDADVRADGTASDLYLFVWGRARTDDLHVDGDAAALSDWQSAVAM